MRVLSLFFLTGRARHPSDRDRREVGCDLTDPSPCSGEVREALVYASGASKSAIAEIVGKRTLRSSSRSSLSFLSLPFSIFHLLKDDLG